VYLDENYPHFELATEPDDTICPGLRQTILKRWSPGILNGPIITNKDKGKIKCPIKRHIVQKYEFRNFKTIPEPWRCFLGTTYSLNFGIRLMACSYNPTTHYAENDTGVFHLLFLWRDKEEYNGIANPFYALKKFIKHLEMQRESKIKAVILRPVSPIDAPDEYVDLHILNFLESKRANTEKLKHMYKHVLGAFESKMEDDLGGNYWSVPFKPKDPVENPDFRWPKLLQKR
jgi:hypothetical protein